MNCPQCGKPMEEGKIGEKDETTLAKRFSVKPQELPNPSVFYTCHDCMTNDKERFGQFIELKEGTILGFNVRWQEISVNPSRRDVRL